ATAPSHEVRYRVVDRSGREHECSAGTVESRAFGKLMETRNHLDRSNRSERPASSLRIRHGSALYHAFTGEERRTPCHLNRPYLRPFNVRSLAGVCAPLHAIGLGLALRVMA